MVVVQTMFQTTAPRRRSDATAVKLLVKSSSILPMKFVYKFLFHNNFDEDFDRFKIKFISSICKKTTRIQIDLGDTCLVNVTRKRKKKIAQCVNGQCQKLPDKTIPTHARRFSARIWSLCPFFVSWFYVSVA